MSARLEDLQMSDETTPEPRLWPGSHMFPSARRPGDADSGATVPAPRAAAESAESMEWAATAAPPHQKELFPAPPPAYVYVYGAPAGPPIPAGARDRLARAAAAVRAAGARAGAWPAASGADPPAARTPSFPPPEGLRGSWPTGRVVAAGVATFVLAMTAGVAVAASGGNPAGDAGQVSSPGLAPGQGQGQGFGPGAGRGGHRGFGPQDFGNLPGFVFPGGTTATDPAPAPVPGLAT
jgi:hypothetical protein